MINRKFEPLVLAFFMSLLMSGLMSLIISFYHIGPVASFALIWLKAWAVAFILAFPTVLLVGPVVKKLVGMVVED